MNLLFLLVILVGLGIEPSPLAPPVQVAARVGAAAGAMVAVVAAAFAVAALTAWRLRRSPTTTARTLRQYYWLRWLHFVFEVAVFGLIVHKVGWGAMIYHTWRLGEWTMPATLLLIAPFLLTAAGAFAGFYGVDLALRRQSAGGNRGTHTFWTRGQYVEYQLRGQFGVWILLIACSSTLRDVLHWTVPLQLQTEWFSLAASGLSLVLVILFSPQALRLVLRAKPLPPGELRERLEAQARQLRFRCRDILVWNTNRGVANAAVTGLLPGVRYVLLSDALIDHLSNAEIEAVFAHEVGHIRHHHMGLYFLFAAGSSTMIFLTAEALEPLLNTLLQSWSTESLQWIGAYVPIDLLLLAPYFFVVFGYLSRRCERQADTFAFRTAAQTAAANPGPLATFAFDAGVWTPQATQPASVVISALEKVALLNGIARKAWSWRHGSIAQRVAFLERLALDPSLADRVDRSTRHMNLALIAGVATAVALLAWLTRQ